MAHKEQREFCESVKKRFPWYFKSMRVLDCGSLDINGNNRYLFEDCYYLGIDKGPGPNVDLVCPIDCFVDKPYDTIISTECFEHDKYYPTSLQRIIIGLLAPKGMFLFTCATTGRPEHGTKRSDDSAASPYTDDYYKNLTAEDIQDCISLDLWFERYELTTLGYDLRFWGIKKGE